MRVSKLPKSIRKFLRKEKAQIRREILNSKEAESKIQELVVKIAREYSKGMLGAQRN